MSTLNYLSLSITYKKCSFWQLKRNVQPGEQFDYKIVLTVSVLSDGIVSLSAKSNKSSCVKNKELWECRSEV